MLLKICLSMKMLILGNRQVQIECLRERSAMEKCTKKLKALIQDVHLFGIRVESGENFASRVLRRRFCVEGIGLLKP